MDIQDRVVIVTGASMGIGAATARLFARAGAKVVLAARSAEPLQALAQELGEAHALSVPTDMTDRTQVEQLVSATLERFGRIDMLVNNAGAGLSGPVATLNDQSLEQIFALNVLGPLYAIQAVVPHMRKPAGGLIINVSSMVTKLNIPTIGGYRASKMALNALSDNARLELARDNIRVITVYPGLTETNFAQNTLDGNGGSALSNMRQDSPEHVARQIIAGVRAESREVFMNRPSRVIALVGTIFPSIFERVIARNFRSS